MPFCNAYHLQHRDPVLSLSQLLQLKHPEPLIVTLARFGLKDLPEEVPTLEQVFPGIAQEGRDRVTPKLLAETGLGDLTSAHLAEADQRKVGGYEFENLRLLPGSPVNQDYYGVDHRCQKCQHCLVPAFVWPQTFVAFPYPTSVNHSELSHVKHKHKVPRYLPQCSVHHRHEHMPMVLPRYSPLFQLTQSPIRDLVEPTFAFEWLGYMEEKYSLSSNLRYK